MMKGFSVLGRQPQARFLDLGDNIVDGDTQAILLKVLLILHAEPF